MAFRVEVPQAVLDDLRRRLDAARWPEAYALERGGHFWAAETPEQFADRLRGFLAEHVPL
jgi:hypothetical protein